MRRGRKECPRRAHSFFVPKSTLERLISPAAVARDMHTKEEQVKEPEAFELAERVCREAKQLYAVLAFVKKGPSITSLLRYVWHAWGVFPIRVGS